MRSIISIALKDIKLLLRDRMAAFFVLAFPLLMGLFFGLMITPTSSGGTAKMNVAIVDADDSKYSQRLITALEKHENLKLEKVELEAARKSVQAGKRIAMLVIPKGFGEKAGLFWEEQPSIQLGVDPSRSAEGSMLEGFVMEAVGSLTGERFTNSTEMTQIAKQSLEQIRNDESLSQDRRTTLLDFFGTFDQLMESIDEVQKPADQPTDIEDTTAERTGSNFKLASIERIDVTREMNPNSVATQIGKMRSRWDISFPQAMLWGILGCVAGFAIAVAQEREAGTLLRLHIAPLTRTQLLFGKALACFLMTLAVITMMTAVGYALGMRPLSYAKLSAAAFAVSLGFVGIMMTLSTLGRTVQSVSGIGWAANLIMAMIGGCMIPIMFMPEFIAKLSVVSPVRWAIQSLEGAIWRDFTWSQLAVPCSVMLGIGFVGLCFGILNSRRME